MSSYKHANPATELLIGLIGYIMAVWIMFFFGSHELAYWMTVPLGPVMAFVVCWLLVRSIWYRIFGHSTKVVQ